MVKLSNNEIIKRMNIGKSTFYRYIAELMKDGIVKQEKDVGYSISTELFPIYFSKKNMVENFKDQLEQIKNSMDEELFAKQPVYPVYQQFFFYYNKGFEGLRMSPKEFVMNLQAGLFTPKRKGSKLIKKPILEG